MNSNKFNDVVQEQLKRCTDILCVKADEYAADDDRLHNFKAAAGYRGIDPKDALMGMATKHLVSISDMCKTGNQKTYSVSMWNEKITDAMNYMLLLRGLVEEEMEENK